MIGYHYLATPYSRQPDRALAAETTARIAYHLMQSGYGIYAPIIHGHAIVEALYPAPVPADAGFWEAQNLAMMESAIGIFVACIPGWRESLGVEQEIAWFRMKSRLVTFVRWPEFAIGEEPFES